MENLDVAASFFVGVIIGFVAFLIFGVLLALIDPPPDYGD